MRRLAPLVALALALTAGGPPQRGFEVAVQDDATVVHGYYGNRDAALAIARRLGASWLRVTVGWANAANAWARAPAEPDPLPWSWAPWDAAVDDAAAHGLHVELTLTGPAPAWATGNRRVGVFAPDARRFGEFVAAAAAHFRGRVGRYSIWNEPNYAGWLQPPARAAAIYRSLYLAGSSSLARVDPSAGVLIGETAGPAQPGRVVPALRFLRAVACAGCRRLVADGYAHHPYDFLHPPEHRYRGADDVTLGSLDRLTGALDGLAAGGRLSDRGDRPLDVYLTEFGYLRGSLPQAERATRLVRAFSIAVAARPRVRQLLQYLLLEPPPGFPGGRFDTAIGTTAGAPQPPLDALAAWAHRSAPLLAPPAPPREALPAADRPRFVDK